VEDVGIVWVRRQQNTLPVANLDSGATIKKRSVKRVEFRVVFSVCHAISMAITVVLPAPVASLSAIRGISGFIARSRSLSVRGAISDNQIAVSAASIWQKNRRRVRSLESQC
jgi:hypothetical protein